MAVSDNIPDDDRLTVPVDIRQVLTPEMLAAAFVRMNSNEQAEVFHEIQRQAEKLYTNSYPQMQWCYLAKALIREGHDSPGWQFACDIGSFTMIHTYRLLEGREGRSV